MRRAMIANAALFALAGAGMMSPMQAIPDVELEPEPARNRPSGNTPVSGGGARERARRLARMAKETE